MVLQILDENNPNLSRPSNFPGMMEVDGRKVVQEISNKRRALSLINHNIVNKRAITGKHEACEKKQADQIHRPMTRKLAAEIAKTQQPWLQNANSNAFGDSIFIDEDLKSLKDHPVPMNLEETEAEAIHEEEATCSMEEVEMEDLAEPIIDIDDCDSKNPLAVVDYIDDLYSFYKKIESLSCVSPNYMANQPDINERMRAILIDWLIEVHDKFELMSETLFLTVNLIDRFLAKQSVVRKKLQLVGLVAMLLACKYEEISVPVVGDLILISDKAYSRKEILDMETLMLKTLQFNMSVPTPYVFMRRFLKAAQSNKKLEQLSFFLIELSLVEFEMLKFSPSLLASAAVYTAQCTLHGFRQWSRTCEWHSNYSEQQLLECSKLMVSLHEKAATGKLTGVHRKYSSCKFGFTAKCSPASFLKEQQL